MQRSGVDREDHSLVLDRGNDSTCCVGAGFEGGRRSRRRAVRWLRDKDTEQIVYAEADVTAVQQARYAEADAGHYHLPDIFRLEVDRSRDHAVHFN